MMNITEGLNVEGPVRRSGKVPGTKLATAKRAGRPTRKKKFVLEEFKYSRFFPGLQNQSGVVKVLRPKGDKSMGGGEGKAASNQEDKKLDQQINNAQRLFDPQLTGSVLGDLTAMRDIKRTIIKRQAERRPVRTTDKKAVRSPSTKAALRKRPPFRPCNPSQGADSISDANKPMYVIAGSPYDDTKALRRKQKEEAKSRWVGGNTFVPSSSAAAKKLITNTAYMYSPDSAAIQAEQQYIRYKAMEKLREINEA